MTRNMLVCFAALAMTLAACSQDEAGGTDTAGAPVSFSAGIPSATNAAPATRTANGGTTWLTTDEIGIIMAAGPTLPADIVAGGDNVMYRPASAGAATTSLTPVGTPIYWPETAGGYRFIAYYPWLPVGEGGIDPTDYTYPLDVSDQSDPAKLDLLWVYTVVDPSNYGENVSFDFRHRMAKLRVNITAGGTLTAADLAGCTAEANGMPTTGKYSLELNTISDKGNVAPIALPAVTPGEGYAATFEAIVINLAYEEFKGRYLKFTLPGAGDYYWTIPDGIVMAGGYINTFNLTITAQDVTFTGSSITAWDDSGTGTGGKVEESDYVIQPEANSYMVEPNGKAILIPISQANRVTTADGLGATTTGLGGVTAGNFTVELVWGDTPVGEGGVIKAMQPYKEYIYLEPGIAGNAVVAIRDTDSGNIKWSWHIWVTPAVGSAKDPDTGLTWMDRNLGAAGTTYNSSGKNGLFYQWGRKDAFPGSNGGSANQTYYIGNNTTGTTANPPTDSYTDLPGMVRNPLTFATNSSTYYGSLNVAGEGNKSWNGNAGEKTLYDPCPPGWKMPASGNWGSNTDWGTWENNGRVFKPATVNHFYPATGYRYVNGSLYSVGSYGYYWSDTGSSTANGYTLGFNSTGVNPNSSLYRGNGFAARCVAE